MKNDTLKADTDFNIWAATGISNEPLPDNIVQDYWFNNPSAQWYKKAPSDIANTPKPNYKHNILWHLRRVDLTPILCTIYATTAIFCLVCALVICIIQAL